MEDAKVFNLERLVLDNIRTITLPSKRFTYPVAVILVGGPFSGKTTLVSFLAKHIPLVMLSEVNMASFLAPRATFFKRGTEEIFLLASKTIEQLIKQRVSVIYDASVKKRSDREMLRNLVTEAGGKLLVVHLTLPEEEVYRRLQTNNAEIVRGDRKGFIMDKELFRYELNTIEHPNTDEAPIAYDERESQAAEKVEDQVRSMLRD